MTGGGNSIILPPPVVGLHFWDLTAQYEPLSRNFDKCQFVTRYWPNIVPIYDIQFWVSSLKRDFRFWALPAQYDLFLRNFEKCHFVARY